MANNDQKLLSEYKNLEKTLQNQAKTRKGDAAIEAEKQLINLRRRRDTIESNILKKRWYGEDDDEDQKREGGILEKGINLLNTGVYAGVGAAEIVLGKGEKKGLSNIAANIREKETYGDLLRKYNISNTIAAPMGLAMDIALDPLNWITAGATAIVPRVAYGALKAGPRGAAKGLTTSLASKARTIGKITPILKGTEKFKKFSTKAIEGKEAYNALVGRSVEGILENRLSKKKLGDWVESKIDKTSIGRKLYEPWRGSSKDWLKQSLGDDLTKSIQKAEAGEYPFVPYAKGNRTRAPKDLQDFVRDADLIESYDDPVKFVKDQAKQIVDDGADIAVESYGIAKTVNSDIFVERMAGEAVNDKIFKEAILDEIREVSKEISKDKTGVKWFDAAAENFRNIKVKDVEVGEKVADFYGAAIGTFKVAKVALNPSAYANAVVGNGVMGYMAGLSMHSKGFLNTIKESWQFSRGAMSPEKNAKFIKKIAENPEWARAISLFPDTFVKIFGVHPKFIMGNGKAIADDLIRNAKGALDDVPKAYIDDSIELFERFGGKVELKTKGPKTTGLTETLSEISDKGGEASTFFNQEIITGGFRKMLDAIEEKAKTTDHAYWKALHTYYTKPMDYYGSIDQGFKLGTALHISNVGITERELMTLSKVVPIGQGAVTHDIATDLWRIKPIKAMEVAQEIYMNYGAMPGAIKVLRSLPFFGAPFASFMYGMTVKTGKTLKNNPAVFNKISNFIHEFQGRKSALELEKLDSKYYEWYNREGMIKLPFFQENPIYFNAANMIPYYTMNMFQPSERSYSDRLPNTVVNVFDRLPFFKTPEGQILFDYAVLPMIIRDSNPVGMFDQALWPQDASKIEKFAYTARAIAEIPVPPVAGLAGIIGGIVAPGLTKYAPSFRYRQGANAVQGKTSVGIQSAEDATAKTVRYISSVFGLPWYKMNLTYNTKKTKK